MMLDLPCSVGRQWIAMGEKEIIGEYRGVVAPMAVSLAATPTIPDGRIPDAAAAKDTRSACWLAIPGQLT